MSDATEIRMVAVDQDAIDNISELLASRLPKDRHEATVVMVGVLAKLSIATGATEESVINAFRAIRSKLEPIMEARRAARIAAQEAANDR